jgi:hypothetical protein
LRVRARERHWEAAVAVTGHPRRTRFAAILNITQNSGLAIINHTIASIESNPEKPNANRGRNSQR